MSDIDHLARHDADETDEEYIPVEDVAALLNMTVRSATRYAPKVRTMRAGVRIMYHKGDVEELARKMNTRMRSRKAELQRRDVMELSRSVGRLEGEIAAQQRQLEAQRLELQQAQELRIQLALAEAELDRLRAELVTAQHQGAAVPAEPQAPVVDRPRSWWRKLLS